jgi:hypothetical protein
MGFIGDDAYTCDLSGKVDARQRRHQGKLDKTLADPTFKVSWTVDSTDISKGGEVGYTRHRFAAASAMRRSPAARDGLEEKIRTATGASRWTSRRRSRRRRNNKILPSAGEFSRRHEENELTCCSSPFPLFPTGFSIFGRSLAILAFLSISDPRKSAVKLYTPPALSSPAAENTASLG